MAKAYVTTGRVEKGALKIRNRARMDAFFKNVRDCEVTVTIEKAHATRSADQNALYWAGYIQPLSDYTGYTPLEMHAYLKKRFLPTKQLLIQDANGVVVDETAIEALSTTTLNKVEFGEYLHEIEAFALELGVTVGSNREAA